MMGKSSKSRGYEEVWLNIPATPSREVRFETGAIIRMGGIVFVMIPIGGVADNVFSDPA